MNLIVTGGAGFIGQCYVRLVRRLRPASKVVNLDVLTYAGNLESLADLKSDPGHVFVKGDIRDGALVRKLIAEHQIDAIVNFAAESHVDRSIMSAAPFVETNVQGTLALLEAAKDSKLKRFLQVSTDEVYGSLGPTGAFSETSPIDPRSPYSASKTAADHLVSAFHHTHGLETVTTRCSNNYGPFQFPEKLIPLMILNAFEGKPLPVYGDGMQVRDWIHVEDHAAAIDLVLTRGTTGHVYNIGAENDRPNLSVIRDILRLTGASDSLIKYVADRPGHDRRYAMDASKIRSQLGWKPTRDFEQGLAETVAWYRSNKTWWERVRSGAYREYYQQQYGAI
ncbi:MAG: dTDP-glucose 4,6-dehydratase [Deltaproteobacteria bacterium]|nr:dTDP-glucose 4,6-dehydratase [Deltaproteobacteria bacterium]